MSSTSNSILAVIPARGGSKGIPRKNLHIINNQSLIEHAVRVAQALSCIDKVIITSDDDEIHNLAEQLGTDLSVKRPPELASDNAKSIDAWIHAWLEAENFFNQSFEISVLLEPTSPMRTTADVEQAISLLLNNPAASSVATVSKTPGHYTPHKALQINTEGNITPYLKDGTRYSIRQEIPDFYHRNGICYAVRRNSLIDAHNLMEHGCMPLIINRHVVNIDEEIDLKIAEFLMANT